jgi:hypothetical protein
LSSASKRNTTQEDNVSIHHHGRFVLVHQWCSHPNLHTTHGLTQVACLKTALALVVRVNVDLEDTSSSVQVLWQIRTMMTTIMSNHNGSMEMGWKATRASR